MTKPIRTDKQRLVSAQKRLAGARREIARLRLENRALRARLAKWGRPTNAVRAARGWPEAAPELKLP